MDIIDQIKTHQSTVEKGDTTPAHQPKMLLIGCVDARKDPIADLGIPKGEALILRNVAALVHPEAEGRLTESAALAFAVRHMKVQHIAVMGHTDCGGIRAVLKGISSYSLRDYLAPVAHLVETLDTHADDEASLRQLEQAAVKYSLNSLMGYDYIAEAVEAGQLQLHGWVMHTGSGKIYAYDKAADDFQLL